MTRKERVERLLAAIPGLTDHRLQIIDRIVRVFDSTQDFKRAKRSNLISETALEDFGDVLRIHHCFSREPFSKDKFEYALERVLVGNGVLAKLAPRGQRGFDIEIAGDRVSLKTEAAKAIRLDAVHISKFMELGGGSWSDDPKDLVGLRKQFMTVLNGLDRILILRALRRERPDYLYELVEIPVGLLRRANRGRLEMKTESKQSPKPGYCRVEKDGESLFALYFDGGGERKLQVKGLKKNLCTVHASWRFELPAAVTDTL